MPRTAAVILVAGSSSRFGRSKQLLEFRGQTLLQNAMDAAKGAGCEPVFVVIATPQDRSTATIPDVSRSSGATIIENADWERGLGTSIRAGVQLAASLPDVEAVALMVCDQPFVNSIVIRKLLAAHEPNGKSIIASAYADTLGVPAIFCRRYFGELLQLADNQGAKAVIISHSTDVAEVPFPDGAIDIDTAGDWEALQRSRS
jgi:molybdenum cofactor cytidylyltransferase